jgi:hypothetical protein
MHRLVTIHDYELVCNCTFFKAVPLCNALFCNVPLCNIPLGNVPLCIVPLRNVSFCIGTAVSIYCNRAGVTINGKTRLLFLERLLLLPPYAGVPPPPLPTPMVPADLSLFWTIEKMAAGEDARGAAWLLERMHVVPPKDRQDESSVACWLNQITKLSPLCCTPLHGQHITFISKYKSFVSDFLWAAAAIWLKLV